MGRSSLPVVPKQCLIINTFVVEAAVVAAVVAAAVALPDKQNIRLGSGASRTLTPCECCRKRVK